MNNTNDGQYEIYTGKGDDNDKRGIVEKWDNLTALTFWYSDTCNMINGTDGTIFPVDVPKDERLYVFNTQICRSIFLEAEEDQEIEGIDTTKFVAPSEVFEVDFEDNVGYCTGGEKDECLGNGLLDASKCYSELINCSYMKLMQILQLCLCVHVCVCVCVCVCVLCVCGV